MQTKNIRRAHERGNVLFLILIAVALFAALSYAVTQSSRTGGGDANSETNLINSAQVTQYPASIRTAIIRMMVSNSVDINKLEFNPPSDFDQCSDEQDCVFHPKGGGATWAESSSDVMADGLAHSWIYNGENQVNFIGTTDTSAPTSTSAEVMAILPEIKESICTKINKELGIPGTTPVETGIDVDSTMGTGTGGGTTWVVGLASGPGGTIGGATSAESPLNGQAFGCFEQSGKFYYYHVLIEQ